MDTLSITQIAFQGKLTPQATVTHTLLSISATFTFGQAYLLDTSASTGSGEALSWIVAGVTQPDQGQITRNAQPYPADRRRQDAWCVRWSSIRVGWWAIRAPSVQAQIRYGLRRYGPSIDLNEATLMAQFGLSRSRYNRPLRHLSGEAWRASCAIGVANGKTIFCFPYIDPAALAIYIWFKDLISALTARGALVLLPTQITPAIAGLGNAHVLVAP
jgi:hypothetical protein